VGKFFEELAYHQTSLGELSLRRKRIAMLGDQVFYEIKLGDAFLMSSMFHAVEDALAELGLGALEPGEWDVVVGGLGLGYTAVAALAHPTVDSLLVVDFLAPVIDWHQRGLVPLGPTLTGDSRCRLLHGDFFALAVDPLGFDGGRRFHAVLLDIDHSPCNLLHEQNAAFYSPEGLEALARHLHPGGVFAMWSDDPPEADFLALLQRVFATARAEVVSFPNPLLDGDSASTVYVARTATSKTAPRLRDGAPEEIAL
jgi:spermidine synthase